MTKVLFFLLLCTLNFVCSQKIYFVATNGLDSNDGLTISKPFKTIQNGINQLKPGDKLYIRGGVYPEYVYLKSTSYGKNNISGTLENPISIETYPADFKKNNLAIIDGGYRKDPFDYDAFSNLNILFRIYGDFIHVKNLELRNSRGISLYVGSCDSSAIRRSVDTFPNSGGKHVVIENIHIHHSYGTGIYLHCAYKTTISNCTIHDVYDYRKTTIGGGNADGIGCESLIDLNPFDEVNEIIPLYQNSQHEIKNNTIYNCSDDGIDTWRTKGNRITNNFVKHVGYANTSNGLQITSDTINAGNGAAYKLGGPGGENYVAHNVAYDFRNYGFQANTGTNNQVYNNTAYSDKKNTSGFHFTNVSGNTIINNISNTLNNPIHNSSVSKNNNWDLNLANISFVNSTDSNAFDFLKLQPNSPAIDKGDSNINISFKGIAPDLGAYEYESPSFYKQLILNISKWFD